MRAIRSVSAGKSRRVSQVARLLAMMIIPVLLTACDRPIDREAYLDRAESALASGDTRAALIDLKTVLREDSNNARGRLLFGKVYLQQGKYLFAREEFERALAHGAQPADVLPLQAYVWRRLGEKESVLAIDPEGLPPTAAAAVQIQQASMMMADGWLDDAEALLDEASNSDGDSVKLAIERARMTAIRGDVAESVVLLRGILEGESDPDAWRLLAQLEKRLGNTDAAISAYSEAIKQRAHYYPNRLERAFLYLRQPELDKAQEDLDRVARVQPKNYMLNYAQGLLHRMRGDKVAAMDAFGLSVATNPNYGPALLLLGSLQYETGELNQAIQNLSKFNSRYPGTRDGQFLLGAALGSTGEWERAEPLLESALVLDPDSVLIRIHLARAAVARGDIGAALGFLSQAVELEPDNHFLRSMLGDTYLMGDQPAAAEMEFQTASELSEGYIDRYPSLVRYYLAKREQEDALRIATMLVEKYPDKTVSHNALGNVYFVKGNIAAATASYQAALKLEPGNFTSHAQLATLALQERGFARAEAHYSAILQADPDNVRAQLLLAELERAKGDEAAMTERLQAVVEQHPDLAPPRLTLAQYQLDSGSIDAALGMLREIPETPRLADQVAYIEARALLASGDPDGAMEIFDDLLSSRPDDPRLLYFVGRCRELLGQVEEAEKLYSRSADLDARIINPRVRLHRIYLSRRDIESARAVREGLGSTQSRHGPVMRMEIMEALAVGDTQRALDLGESLQVANPSAENLRLQVGVLWRAGKTALAVQKLEEWLQLHPQDQEIRTSLAQKKNLLGEPDDARQLYESALSDGDFSARTLNNLAYLLLDSDPVRALELANRAVELNPHSAEILDTRAWAEHANGRYQEALQTSTRALSMVPASPVLQWSKIQFQIDVGMNEEALLALRGLLEDHPEEFPGRENAVQEHERLSSSL